MALKLVVDLPRPSRTAMSSGQVGVQGVGDALCRDAGVGAEIGDIALGVDPGVVSGRSRCICTRWPTTLAAAASSVPATVTAFFCTCQPW